MHYFEIIAAVLWSQIIASPAQFLYFGYLEVWIHSVSLRETYLYYIVNAL